MPRRYLAKKYQKRLLKLADFLDKLPPSRFNMNSFQGNRFQEAAKQADESCNIMMSPDEIAEELAHPEMKSCGTTACAGGWAGAMPAFQKAGLIFDVSSGVIKDKNSNTSGFSALANFFGLTEDSYIGDFTRAGYGNDTDHIFGGEWVRTPKDEAQVIRKLVKKVGL